MRKTKTNKKILTIVVLIITMLFTSIIGVYAERIIASSNVTYNNSTSGLSSTNVQGAVDELYLKCVNGENGVTFNFARFFQAIGQSDTIITDDGTADHNMRYTGKSPNNYVTFNGELWRVIGAFNNVDDGNGNKETRVKIIRATSIGNKQWHTSDVNIWKSSSLNAELQALSYASNSMIDNAVWYLGDPGGNLPIALTTYEKERETKVATGNDPTWTGKVGLMYSSDFGFASSLCKDGAKTVQQYEATDIDCKGTDWLYTGYNEWLLLPVSGSTTNIRLLRAGGSVGSSRTFATLSVAVRPTVYLKSNVICKNCNEVTAGTQSNPFQIG